MWLLEFCHEEIAPAHLDATAGMDLQRDHAVGLSDLLIHQIDHLHNGVEDRERALLEPSADKIVNFGQPIAENGGRPVVGLVG